MKRLKTMLAIGVLAMVGCGDGQLSTDGFSTGEGTTSGGETTGGMAAETNNASMQPEGTDTVGTTTGTNRSTNNATVAPTNNATSQTNSGTTGGTSGETAGPQDHPMFVAVADFMREKCIACHSEGQNGNFQIDSADATNAEVREDLEDVEATNGNLLVEPNDPANSQVYIMITNDAGEQFDDATIAIVEDWINAGAPYVQ